jgi:hypothetical protein
MKMHGWPSTVRRPLPGPGKTRARSRALFDVLAEQGRFALTLVDAV